MAGRRLAVIVLTDMEGYTPLSHANEAGALRLVKEHERLVQPLLKTYHGRKVKSTGDGMLLEFPNTLEALRWAVDLQRAWHERRLAPGEPDLNLRVGIHLGEVQRRGADILGDAVNIAARVEPLAEPGGICLTSQVFEQVRTKGLYQFDRLGPRLVKGVAEPLDLYRVILPWVGSAPSLPEQTLPRLAVLPLANISPDPGDEYFADGLTEELITALSHLQGLRVIARTSVVQYKATTKSVAQIGSELRVTSVLEGSVRKAGNQLRISMQLIDTVHEDHVWATTYDRELGNVFALQAEIAREVAEALRVRVDPKETHRIENKTPVDPESYLAYLKGKTQLDPGSAESLAVAKECFERAITLDPRNAAAYAGLADVIRYTGWFLTDAPRELWEAEARLHTEHALELDPNLAEAHGSRAIMLWDDFRWDEAESEFRRSLALNPNAPLIRITYAGLLLDECRTREALHEYELSEALDPRSGVLLSNFARLLRWIGDWGGSKSRLDRLREIEPVSGRTCIGFAEYYVDRSDAEGALQEIRAAESTQTDPRVRSLIRVWRLHVEGHRAEAVALLRTEAALHDEQGTTQQHVAQLWAELGDLDEAIRWLNKAADHHTLAVQLFRYEPLCAPLREYPPFEDFLRKIHLTKDGPPVR